MKRRLQRCAWAMALVLGATAVLFWPLRWAPVAVGLAIVAWWVRRRSGIAAPLALLAVLWGVVYAAYHAPNWNFLRPFDEWAPPLTPNPTRISSYDLPVISWLTNHHPYHHGVVLPILLWVVPPLLVAALVYAWQTGPRRRSKPPVSRTTDK